MQSTSDPLDVTEQHVLNYVPDEICVVVASRDVDNPAAYYEQIRARLNSEIVELLKDPVSIDQPLPGPLGPDLTPVVLRKRFAGAPAVLQPLRRARRESCLRLHVHLRTFRVKLLSVLCSWLFILQ